MAQNYLSLFFDTSEMESCNFQLIVNKLFVVKEISTKSIKTVKYSCLV